jgi:predicted PurR-regulated permease PerM
MIGAQTAGIFGMLVAIPIATILKITINQMSWSFNNYHVFKTTPGTAHPPQVDSKIT